MDGAAPNLTKPDKEKTNIDTDFDHDDSHQSFSTSEDANFNFDYLPQQRNHITYEFFNQKADLLCRSKSDPDNELF